MLTGFVGAICLLGGLYFFVAPEWLVINNQPGKADAAIVLGGGGAARLRKALTLYDEHFVNQLVLVDKDEAAWRGITQRLCPDCKLNGRNVTILSGSESTWTDAELTLSFCERKGYHSVLVITDPYHSRRADIVFKHFFRGSNTDVKVVNSGDYGRLVPPGKDWRHDQRTREVIWMETGKILALILPSSVFLPSSP